MGVPVWLAVCVIVLDNDEPKLGLQLADGGGDGETDGDADAERVGDVDVEGDVDSDGDVDGTMQETSVTDPAAPAPVVGEPPTYVTGLVSFTPNDTLTQDEPPPPPAGRLALP